MSNRKPPVMKLHEWVQIGKVNWQGLSRNPNAIQLLEKNLDKVIRWALSGNPNAIQLLEKNLDKVDWWALSFNPNIFTYDYNKTV
jgi:hypothetical protein